MNGEHLFLIFTILNNVLFIAFPVWAFIRLRAAGIVVGALFLWGFGLLLDPAMAALHRGGNLFASPLVICLFVGWALSLA